MSQSKPDLANLSREEKLKLVAELAAKKKAKAARQPKLYPLSFAQERMWFLHQLDPASQAHSIFRSYVLLGRLDIQALEAAARDLVRRHDALRTGFVLHTPEDSDSRSEPRARVTPADLAAETFQVARLTLDGVGPETTDDELLDLARERALAEGRRPFALDDTHLWRAAVLSFDDERHALFLTFHHIVCDGWSLNLIRSELANAYAAHARGETPDLPELPIRYSDFARWQNEELDIEGQLDHWQRTLDGVPTVIELPTDRPRPPMASLRGDVAPIHFEGSAVDGLRRLAQGAERGTTPFMTLLALVGTLLSRLSDQRDLLLGTPVANRHHAELEGLVGSFANTLVIRVDLRDRPTFRQLLDRVRKQTLDALDHQDLPFGRLVEALQPERDLSRNPLFQVMFAMVDTSSGAAAWGQMGDLRINTLDLPARGLSKVDLTFEIFATDTYRGIVEYATDLYDRRTIDRMIRAFHRLVAGVLDNPDRPVDAYPILDADTEQRLIVELNRPPYRGATEGDAAKPDTTRPLHRLVAEVAARQGDAVAVETVPATLADGTTTSTDKIERTLTYTELVDRARRLGRHLRGLGARAGQRVGVCLERSAEAVVAFLGVLESGAAFVPLDPTYPRERLAFLVEDSKISILLTQSSLVENLPEVAETLLLDRHFDELTGAAAGSAEPLPDASDDPASAGPGDPAYVIYTSGSTGKPKGVLIPHRAVANHGQAIVDRYALGPTDRILQFASLAFDIAIEEIFPTWLAGATLVVRDEEQSLAFADFFHMLDARRVSIANLPTPYWHEWVSELAEGRSFVPKSLRLMVVGTEQALPERLQAWLRTVGDHPRWINAYGPSEATVSATAWNAPPALDAAGEPTVVRHAPIGLPVAGVSAHVLDASLRPVDEGVIGELYVGGAGIGLGYLDRPRLTAAAFVPDPFAEALGTGPGARLYATGDRARRLPGGDIEFLGRLDHQVKIRGFRIEVGEIEAVLAEHPRVKEAVVLAIPADSTSTSPGGDHRLAAYVVHETNATLAPRTLHNHVADRLPGYMVPSAFVILDDLPMTPSGKVDRRALPAPDWSVGVTTQSTPRTPQEEILEEIWTEILSLPSVGIHDDFFQLGGHSLLATRMLSRIQTVLGVALPLDAVFGAPTIAQLSERIHVALRDAAGTAAAPPITPRAADAGPPPLSFAQQRMWFLQQLEPESFAYNMPTALELTGDLDGEALRRSLEEVVRRHETLRTTFVSDRGQPVVTITPADDVELDLPIEDVRSKDAMVERTREISNHPFDLAKDFPLRLALLRLTPDAGADGATLRHRLVFVFHHVASDGWSTDRFVHELVGLYNAFSQGADSPLRPLPITYGDYATWQRTWIEGEILDQQIAFWKDEMAGATTALDLPTDRPRPPVRDYVGGRVYFDIDAELDAQQRSLGRRFGATPYILYLTAWATLLHRITRQADILVGTPVAGRQRPEVEELIGFFVNTVVIRTRFSDDPSYAELLGRVRSAVLAAHRHQELPFERLVDALEIEREMSLNPLFQSLFVLHHGAPRGESVAPPYDGGGLQISMPSVDNHTSRFDLSLVLVEKTTGLGGFIEYPTDLFDRPTVERLVERFQRLLEGLVAQPKGTVGTIDLLGDADRQRLLDEWNSTSRAIPRQTLHGWIDEAAAEHAERTAVTSLGAEPEVSWTYRQLIERARRLGHHLRAAGAGPEDLVGVLMHRSPDTLATLLGILEAGAAYLPLDPAYPRDRLAFMVESSGARLVVTAGKLPEATRLDALADRGVRFVNLDTEAEAIAARSAEALGVVVDPEQLAYALYTSGSTGQPKGVQIPHRAMVNFLASMAREPGLDADDVLLSITTLSFDIAGLEHFLPLVVGGQVKIADRTISGDGIALRDVLADSGHGITAVQATPATWRMLVDAGWSGDEVSQGERSTRGLKVLSGGEALPTDLARELTARAAEVWNVYGPTETTVWSTARRVEAGGEAPFHGATVPVGTPIDNTTIYLLDSHGQPVPPGVAGELLIGGAGLARGYRGRGDLTADRFVPHPFADGERLYRTGDLARYRVDPAGRGDLEFLGRLDHQVKVRGFRIELGEIESVLREHPEVDQAVVVARVDGNAERLVGYVVPADGASAETEALRRHLGSHLPDYMVPALFVHLDALPLTPNGKVDRKALPAPKMDRSSAGGDYVAPRNATEETLAEIWCRVLGIERVGVHDSFFGLGGHSLLATQVMVRTTEAFDIELPLRTLFTTPTIAAIADAILAKEISQVDDSALEALLAELE